MTLITFQDGQPVMRDGKIGTEQGCCCECAISLTAYIGFSGDPNFPEFNAEYCEGLNANLEWLLAAAQAAGWSASISTTQNRPPEIPDDQNSCWGYFRACCNTSDVSCPADGLFPESDYENQPEWFNVSAYDGGEPFPGGVNWWLCGNVLSQAYSSTAGATFIPICNPLP